MFFYYCRYQNAEKCNMLPEPCLEMGSEGMVRFLKAKLKALETEIQTLHSDCKKKVSGHTLSCPS